MVGARGWKKIPKLSNVTTTTTTLSDADEGCARGCTRQYYNGTVMVCVCVCVYTLENVSVTAGARSIGRARYGLWTATERQLRAAAAVASVGGPPLGHPPLRTPRSVVRPAHRTPRGRGPRRPMAETRPPAPPHYPRSRSPPPQCLRCSFIRGCVCVRVYVFFFCTHFSDFILLKHGRTSVECTRRLSRAVAATMITDPIN